MNAKARKYFDDNQDRYMNFQYLPTTCLLVSRRKNNNYTVRKSNNTWSRWITINITNKRQMVICGSRSDARRRTQLNYSIFQQGLWILSLIMRSESFSVMPDSLRCHGLYSPQNSPGQDMGVGSFSLLQGIFPTQGLNPGLPHCRQIFLPAEPQGKPLIMRRY